MILAIATAPVIILLLTAGGLIGLRVTKARLGTHWLVASGGALVAWGAAFWQRSLIPDGIPLISWLPETIYKYSPVLVFDHQVWSYAMALMTICLAVILTDVAQPERIEWGEWAGSLFLSGLGLLAILAGNPMTLILAWAAIDMAEMAILMTQAGDRIQRSQIVLGFAVRIIGISLLVWAVIFSSGLGVQLSMDEIPPEVRVYVLIASGVRLGALYLKRSHLTDIYDRRSLGTISDLVSGVSGLMPILYVARSGGIESGIENPMLLVSFFLGFFSALAWLRAKDELQARSAWVLGMSALVLAGAILGRPQSAAAWGLTMLLSGGVLFLFTTRRRLMMILPGLGLLSLATVPYFPGWGGAALFADGFNFKTLPFTVVQTLFCVGYVRHASRPEPGLEAPERWVWAVYPWGLAMLPGIYGFIFWLTEKPEPSVYTILPSVIVIVLSAAWLVVPRLTLTTRLTERQLLPGWDTKLPQVSFAWLNRGLSAVYKIIGSGFEIGARLLEGEGGVIWALLILVLLLAIVLQASPAGGL
jgi:hypothetical protein